MFRYAAIFGGIAGIVIIAIMSSVLALGGDKDFAISETLGYLVMLVVLSLIFIGVKRYRDMETGGTIAFAPAFGLGVGIAAVAAVFYALSWEMVLAFTDYAFIDEYGGAMIANAQALPEAQRAARIEEVEASMTLYRNPAFRFMISMLEIFPVGLVVALVSALLLKNPRVLPAKVRA